MSDRPTVPPSHCSTVRLHFSVRDTGIGMDEQQIAKLFQAFGQADTSTTRKYGGSGLGLVISRKLVEGMGGELGVESMPGKGSAFFFHLALPVAEESAKTGGFPDLRVSGGCSGSRVLVVDDQPVVREVLRELLESCRLTVCEAADGMAAVDMAVQADRSGMPYEVILMDWKMPGELDGLQAVERLRQLREQGVLTGPEIPVCIISAYSREDMPPDHPPFHVFLSKPVTASSLVDAMIEATRGRLAAPDHDSCETSDTTRQSAWSHSIPSFAGASILLVEDNPVNQEVAREMLQMTGADVTIANNGREAVELTHSRNFDLILMDLQMPVMDGFAATRRIRAAEDSSQKSEVGSQRSEIRDQKSEDGEGIPEYLNSSIPESQHSRIPILALTAAVMEADRKMAREAGMDGHLAKPINSAELYHAMTQWLPEHGETPAGGGKFNEERDAGVVLPAVLAGFDLAQGLRAFDGNTAFFRKMLWGFKVQVEREFSALPAMLARLEQAQDEDDLEARRMAHTLKGVAGTVRAQRLTAAAEAIDRAFKDERKISLDLREELTAALEEARAGLCLLSAPPLTDGNNLVAEDILPALHRLLAALRSGELVKDDLLDEVTGFVRAELGRSLADELRAKVNDFAYDDAAVLLREGAGKLGMKLEPAS